MDKRWLGIIIILIIGLICMYGIVINSNTVGNAVTVINDVSITLPPGYKTANSHTDDATLLNENNNETIIIKCIKKGNNALKEFNEKLSSIEKNDQYKILENSTNKTVNIIKYQNTTSKKDVTLVFFEKEDRTFYMKMDNFKNDTQKETDILFIINQIKHDYKQKNA